MKLGDRKQLMIAGGVAAVALIALLFVVMRGKKSPGATGPGMGAMRGGRAVQTSAPGAPGTPNAARGGGQAAGGAGLRGAGQAGGGAPAGPGGLGGAAAEGGAEGLQTAQLPMLGVIRLGSGETSVTTRPDPMLTFVPPPPPILPEQRVALPVVQTYQGGIRPLTVAAGRQAENVPQRRVAGIKFNGGAWAILERDGESFVVKPGDIVEGTKVLSISRDQIMVVDSDGQRWQVPLRGAWPTTGGATQLGGRAGQTTRAAGRAGQMGRGGGRGGQMVGRTAGLPTSPPDEF
jgi:hypothetical protein